MVGIICPPPVEIGLTDLPKNGGGGQGPPVPGSDSTGTWAFGYVGARIGVIAPRVASAKVDLRLLCALHIHNFT